MNHDSYDDDYIAGILRQVRTVAMIGASANTVRPSYFVMKYLLAKGYTVIPVNPGLAGQQILGQEVVGTLEQIAIAREREPREAARHAKNPERIAIAREREPREAARHAKNPERISEPVGSEDALVDVPGPVQMVDIFRNAEAALEVTRDAIRLKDRLGIEVIWMQLGVRNDTAAAEAEAAGLKVVMHRCPKIEYGRLSGEIAWAGVNSGRLTSQRPKLSPKGVQSHLIED